MIGFKDIAKLFESIEKRLIKSLKNNLASHKAAEKAAGLKYSDWRAEKIRNIEKFRRENRKIVKDYADVIDRDTRQLMEEQFREGEKLAEREVEKVTGSPVTPISDEHFFGVNSEKMDKLITDITELEKNAESAALRMTDDVYRQTLHRAQLEMGTGSMTINQAVDMATREFLDKGINCIIYKDGKRVNIADYVRMALRTTSTRAQLQGKAKRFAELGYDTVLISQYGMCSKTCLPWQGKVYIDDVFTVWDGERRDGMGKSKYCGKWFPLLSVAMEAGLFHPNCRHTMSLWVEGVSKLPEPLNEAEIKEKSAAEQKQRELERKIRKHKRQVIGSTDEENVREAKKKLREAQKKLRELIDEHEELRRDYEREKVYDTAPSQPQETPQKPSEHPQSEIIPPEKKTPQSADMSVSEDAANKQQKQAEMLPDVQTSDAAKTAADIPETAPGSQQGNVAETVDISEKIEDSKPKKAPAYTDVTQEYEENATPGEGELTFDEGYDTKEHKEETSVAEWLHEKFGGYLNVNNEFPGHYNVSNPDYVWKGKFWDLKTTTTEASANYAVRKGVNQITDERNYKNKKKMYPPGGVILDYGDRKISFEVLLKVIERRMARFSGATIDIMIVQNKKVIMVLRYDKK